MEGDRGVEGEEGVGWVHEALFFVGLDVKDEEPEVEWCEEDGCAERCLTYTMANVEEVLDYEEWDGG